MKHLLLLLLLILSLTSSFSQKHYQDVSDSLFTKLSLAKEDTNKVVLLKNISQAYSQKNDSIKSFEYAKKAISLSLKINWEKGIMSTNRHLGILYSEHQRYREAILCTQNGLKKGFEKKYLEEYINSLNNIAIFHEQIDDSLGYAGSEI